MPTVNTKRAARRTAFLPIIWENEAHVGWKTVEVSRKLVPHQKAWIAVVPFRSLAIIGIATDRIVASCENFGVSLLIKVTNELRLIL